MSSDIPKVRFTDAAAEAFQRCGIPEELQTLEDFDMVRGDGLIVDAVGEATGRETQLYPIPFGSILVGGEEYKFDADSGVVISSGATVEGELRAGPRTILYDGSSVLGQVVLGDDCKIYGLVEDSHLGDSVSVASGASVTGSRTGNEVSIGAGAEIKHSIIGSSTSIGQESTVHAFRIGDETSIGSHCKLETDTTVGNYNLLQDYSHLAEGAKTLDEVTLQSGAEIGTRTTVEARVTLGRDVRVGADSTIGEGSYVLTGVRLPDGVEIQPRTLIHDDTYVQIAHVDTVFPEQPTTPAT
ncbi:MAG TPA: hypothetical protein VJP80_05355 [Candidatus Saccharimonadales bacterium]|nr:hypothetical protein [Candidatus Saccharimonadales bacterium]